MILSAAAYAEIHSPFFQLTDQVVIYRIYMILTVRNQSTVNIADNQSYHSFSFLCSLSSYDALRCSPAAFAGTDRKSLPVSAAPAPILHFALLIGSFRRQERPAGSRPGTPSALPSPGQTLPVPMRAEEIRGRFFLRYKAGSVQHEMHGA